MREREREREREQKVSTINNEFHTVTPPPTEHTVINMEGKINASIYPYYYYYYQPHKCTIFVHQCDVVLTRLLLYLLPVNADHFPADTKEAFLLFRLTMNRATLIVSAEIAPINTKTLALHVE